MNVDESYEDCPNIFKYAGQLLAQLTWDRYLEPRVFSYFTKQYREYSELHGKGEQKKRMRKMHDAALKALKGLGAKEGKWLRDIENNMWP